MAERIVTLEFEGKPDRLDKVLVRLLPEYSRSRIQNWIKSGLVAVDNAVAGKSGQIIDPGSVIDVAIPHPKPSDLKPERIPLNILFENENLLVVNKPAGMVVHPSAGHSSGTLVHAALAHAPEIKGVGGVKRPGVVHRLDKDTSGIILLAKNDRSHRHLQNQFRKRMVKKVYIALVDGTPPTPRGIVDAAIGRDPNNRLRMAVVPPLQGRESQTDYLTLETFSEHTLLEIYPLTGRTHQIRTHLAFIDCPVAGDTLYGRREPSIPMDRHFLHAYKLTISLSGEDKPRIFIASLPEDLESILTSLRENK